MRRLQMTSWGNHPLISYVSCDCIPVTEAVNPVVYLLQIDGLPTRAPHQQNQWGLFGSEIIYPHLFEGMAMSGTSQKKKQIVFDGSFSRLLNGQLVDPRCQLSLSPSGVEEHLSSVSKPPDLGECCTKHVLRHLGTHIGTEKWRKMLFQPPALWRMNFNRSSGKRAENFNQVFGGEMRTSSVGLIRAIVCCWFWGLYLQYLVWSCPRLLNYKLLGRCKPKSDKTWVSPF